MSPQVHLQDNPSKNRAVTQLVPSSSRTAWAVVLAGGDGTRLQRLTLQISGDNRPKQFCKLMGGDSLLTQTSRRIAPLFADDRQLYVLTRAHQVFYRDEFSFLKTASILEQPCNRGTAVAIGAAAVRILKNASDPLVAFFPSDHHYSNDAAFVRAVDSAIEYSRHNPNEIILLSAEPTYPEVEYGWIEPGAVVSDMPGAQLSRVTRFWEKPSLAQARTLFQRRCLWNTFVTIGRAATFLELLRSRFPTMVTSIEAAAATDDFDCAYRKLPAVDISREVFSPQPSRLLAFRDTESGWADLGTPVRVFDVLARNAIIPEWLSGFSADRGSSKRGDFWWVQRRFVECGDL
jgi:mannose-1-phosphate guanylyltransferase